MSSFNQQAVFATFFQHLAVENFAKGKFGLEDRN
jgi:hypothetical protein